MNPWTLLLVALGLVMFVEGLPYFVSPGAVRRWLHMVDSLSDASLRLIGGLMMAAGLLVAWLAMR